jgi:CRP-like cAMP-binding protein
MSLDDTDHFEIRKVKFQPGEHIYRKGISSHSKYFLTQGEVSIVKNGNAERFSTRVVEYENQDLIANSLVEGVEFKVDQFEELALLFDQIKKQA